MNGKTLAFTPAFNPAFTSQSVEVIPSRSKMDKMAASNYNESNKQKERKKERKKELKKERKLVDILKVF